MTRDEIRDAIDRAWADPDLREAVVRLAELVHHATRNASSRPARPTATLPDMIRNAHDIARHARAIHAGARYKTVELDSASYAQGLLEGLYQSGLMDHVFAADALDSAPMSARAAQIIDRERAEACMREALERVNRLIAELPTLGLGEHEPEVRERFERLRESTKDAIAGLVALRERGTFTPTDG